MDEPAEAQPQADTAVQIFVVGDGTPASCTKDAIQYELWAALAAGGGRVFFNCGPAPVTIPIVAGSSGQPLSFFDNTTIDGGGRITLQAQLDGPNLAVNGEARVLMKNLAIVGQSLFDWGVDNAGNLTVSECTFSGFGAMAIRSRGSLNIVQSTFSNDGRFDTSSAVIIQSGTGSVRRSTFSNNDSFAGGAITNGGTLDIAGSRFIDNFADFGGGGAIANLGVLTIENSEFTGNTGYAAGAVLNYGSLTVMNTTFADNRAIGPAGGAILGLGDGGSMVIRDCDFLNNLGGALGGALYVGGDVTIARSTFSGNHAGRGGAIYTSADPLTIRRSIILANSADIDGGGIFVAAGSLAQDNNTFIANFPNDIVSAAASTTSTAAPSSTVDPEAWNTWARGHALFSLTASPQEIAARRAGPQTQQQ